MWLNLYTTWLFRHLFWCQPHTKLLLTPHFLLKSQSSNSKESQKQLYVKGREGTRRCAEMEVTALSVNLQWENKLLEEAQGSGSEAEDTLWPPTLGGNRLHFLLFIPRTMDCLRVGPAGKIGWARNKKNNPINGDCPCLIDALIMYYIDGRTILQFFRDWWKGKLVLDEDKLSLGKGIEWSRHITLQVNGKKCLWNRGNHLNKQRGNTVTHSAWSKGEMRVGAKLTNLPIQRTQQRTRCNHLICELNGKA